MIGDPYRILEMNKSKIDCICAIKKLGELGRDQDLYKLFEIIKKNKNWQYRQVAVSVLRNFIFSDEIIELLIFILSNDVNWNVRIEAASLLLSYNFEKYLAIIEELLSNEKDSNVRLSLYKLLAKYNDNQIKKLLKNILIYEESKINRKFILEALVSYKESEIYQLIIDILQTEKKWEDRSFGLYLLSKYKPKSILDDLMYVIRNDPVWQVRIEAINVLSKYIDDESLPIFYDVLREEKNNQVLVETLQILDEAEIKVDKNILTNLLDKNEDLNVKFSIIKLLSKLDDDDEVVIIIRNAKIIFQNSRKHFDYAVLLARLEGFDGEGFKILNQLEVDGKLDKYQLEIINGLNKEIELKLKNKELKKELSQFKSNFIQKGELEEKSILEEQIEFLKNTLEEQFELVRYIQLQNSKLLAKLNYEKPRSELIIKDLEEQFDKLMIVRDPIKKGEALETFCVEFFSQIEDLSVIDRNIRFQNEEIDILLKNNIDKPFWQHFKSPSILIECKNTSKPMPSKDIVLFKEKIRNKTNMVKLGFIISINGFTKNVRTEILKAQMDNITLGLITKDDIILFFSKKMTLLEFLEYIITKTFMQS